MNWPLVLEALLLMVVYLVVDRSAFWFMSNTFGQVSGKRPGIDYASIAFPRLLIAAAGCLATAAGKGQGINTLNVAGLIAIGASLSMLCAIIIKKYWVDRDS